LKAGSKLSSIAQFVSDVERSGDLQSSAPQSTDSRQGNHALQMPAVIASLEAYPYSPLHNSDFIQRSNLMATYISLVQFTDKGIQAAKQTTKRIADWAAEVQSKGVSVKQTYWTLGQYDQVCVIEAPDDETAASVLLTADMLGNIRTQTMRAFTTSEMDKILAKVP